jgi:hypothetical protein
MRGSGQPPYKNDDMLSVLREAAEAVDGELTRRKYIAWRERTLNRDGNGRPTRQIAGETRICARFGSWEAGLEQAGLRVDGHPLDRRQRPYTREEAVGALQEAAVVVDGHLSRQQFEAWRERTMQRDETGKPARHIPGAGSITRHFGTWEAALRELGLERPRGCESVSGYKREEVVEILREAGAAVEGALTIGKFEAWRLQKMKEGKNERPRRAIPSPNSVSRHFGSWSAALKAVQP